MTTTSTNSDGSPAVAAVDLVKQCIGGRYIRKVTQVRFADGRTVTFMERVPKRLAITQAREQLAAYPEYQHRQF